VYCFLDFSSDFLSKRKMIGGDFMAHVMKSTVGGCGGLLAHYERELKKDGTHREYGNQEIDLSRVHLNYNLAPKRDGGQKEFIKQRTSEVKCLKRDDVNVMCSWIITAPEGLATRIEQREGRRPLLHFEGKEAQSNLRTFFEESYKFLNGRYGHSTNKNVISAYVHMDEKTPHMHYAFVPVVVDRKKGHEKVSAYEAINRYDLKKFHSDLDKHMTMVFGRDIGVINQATKDGNKTVEELKRETKIIELGVVELRSEKGQLEKEVEHIKELQQLKTKTEEIPIPKKIPMMDKPNMSFQTALKAIEGNNAYVANEAEIKNIRANRSKVKKREDAVTEREVAINRREQELDEREKIFAVAEKQLDSKIKAVYAALHNKPEPAKHVNFGYSSANYIYTRRCELTEKEKQLEDVYDTQINLNQLYEQKLADFDNLWARYISLEEDMETKLKQAEKTISHLSTQNGTLRNETERAMANLKKEKETHADSLKMQIRASYEYMDKIIQAINLLKYNWSSGKLNPYKVERLTDKQGQLIDAITSYGAEKAEINKLDDLAESMKSNMGLSKGMEEHVRALEPKRQIDRGLSR